MTWRSNQIPACALPTSQVAQVQFLTLSTLILLVVPNTFATGTLFECVDAHGKTVFTDSPRQLLACHALDFSSLKDSTAPSVPASAPLAPASGADAGRTSPTTTVSGNPHTTAVPVEHLGNVLVVSATLNDSKQARLILDTGASQTIISQRLALDLGLYSTAHTTQVLLHTASGSVRADAVILDSIRIGGAELRNSQVLIHDLPDLPFAVDGLLGLNFLGAYQITLDTSRGELHLKSSPEKLGEHGDKN